VGVKVLIGVPNMKVHAKLCMITKKINNRNVMYGFVSTGNLNEKTATVYGDHCLLTANKNIMDDVNRMFNYLENPSAKINYLSACKTILPSPVKMREHIIELINREIKHATLHKKAAITIKVNSLSDEILIERLYAAAKAGVEIKLIIRSICCMFTEDAKFKIPVQAISIVDEYLEHARVLIFHNNGDEKVFISSADWMLRNLDHRIEAACPILDKKIIAELKDILTIQLKDNIKARILNNEQNNIYVNPRNTKKVRSQVEIYNYLNKKRGSQSVPDFYIP